MKPSAASVNTTGWITVEEAAARLRVKRETVYAYVSRGRIASERATDGRGSLLDPADVERLANRARTSRRSADEEAESSITLIRDGEVFYRGQPAMQLAADSTFEQFAEMLWGTSARSQTWDVSAPVVSTFRRAMDDLPPTTLPIDLLRIAGAFIAAYDPPEPAASATVYSSTARRFMATTLTCLPALSEPAVELSEPYGVAALLWSRLADHRPSDPELRLLNSTLILLADHDLARSTVAVRVAARAGLDAGAIIRMGMDASGGVVKGVASLAIEAFLRNLATDENVEIALTRRLKQGEPVPGFGHPIHDHGDPRAAGILEMLRETASNQQRMSTVDAVIATQRSRGLPAPNAGFALAALTYVMGMIPGSGETIFVMARAIGWIAHAIEVLDAGPLERSSSMYIGNTPPSWRRS